MSVSLAMVRQALARYDVVHRDVIEDVCGHYVYVCGVQTHTMQGSGNGDMRGIIPRAMSQVGAYKSQLEAKGWTYQMHVSFLEIYNETIRDLLRSSPSDDAKHDIKKDINGAVTVTDLTMRPVDPNSEHEVEAVMEQAARHRSVGQTAMNERSSRSHSVFTLHLKAVHPVQNVTLNGVLNLGKTKTLK